VVHMERDDKYITIKQENDSSHIIEKSKITDVDINKYTFLGFLLYYKLTIETTGENSYWFKSRKFQELEKIQRGIKNTRETLTING